MRKDGKALQEIADATGFSLNTVSRWCKGINMNAKRILEAKALEKQGVKRQEIVMKLQVSPGTLRKWLGPKKNKKMSKIHSAN